MVAVSLLHYLHGRSWKAAWVVILGIASAALMLLGYAAFLGVLISGPTPDGDGLMGPFRWLSSSEMA